MIIMKYLKMLFHKKWTLGFIIYVVSFFQLHAQDSLEISILSCSPGTELYSTFGHSAIRVRDFVASTDYVFNYGTFNFREKNFYLKFMQGKLNYYLTVTTYDEFMYEYQMEDRAVYEQVFGLSNNQKVSLYRDLQINALPANRRYKYDFFWDNCSTRVRDKVEQIFDQKIIYPIKNDNLTFRDYLHKYLTNQPWSRFGIDLILGLPADELTDARKAMFLPLEMMYVYDETKVEGRPTNTASRELFAQKSKLQTTNWFTPFKALSIMLIISALLNIFGKKLFIYTFLKTAFMVLDGLAGLIISFLWFVADHQTTEFNLHLIWANPILLLYPFRKRLFSQSLLNKLSKIFIGMLVALFFWFPICSQNMPQECLIIWFLMILFVFPDTNWSFMINQNQNENPAKPVA